MTFAQSCEANKLMPVHCTGRAVTSGRIQPFIHCGPDQHGNSDF